MPVIPRRNLRGGIDWRIDARPVNARTAADWYAARDAKTYGAGRNALDWLRDSNRFNQQAAQSAFMNALERIKSGSQYNPVLDRQNLEVTAFREMNKGSITPDQYNDAIRALRNGDSVSGVRGLLSNYWRQNQGLSPTQQVNGQPQTVPNAVAPPATTAIPPAAAPPATTATPPSSTALPRPSLQNILGQPAATQSPSIPSQQPRSPAMFEGMPLDEWIQSRANARREPITSSYFNRVFNPR